MQWLFKIDASGTVEDDVQIVDEGGAGLRRQTHAIHYEISLDRDHFLFDYLN